MIPINYKEIILEKLEPLHPKGAAIFGSYARGEQTAASDLDILIDTDSDFSLLDLIAVEQDLSASLGVKVELITKRSMSPYFKPFIEKHLLPLM